MLQRDYWLCPFCDEGTIEILIRLSIYSLKRVKNGRYGYHSQKLKKEIIILTQNCPNCANQKKRLKRNGERKEISK